MSPHQVTTLTLRVFGLFLCALVLLSAPMLLDPSGSFGGLALYGTYLALGVALVVAAPRLAGLVVSGASESGGSSGGSAQGIAFSVLGLYVAFLAGGRLATSTTSDAMSAVHWTEALALAGYAVVLAAGVALFVGGDGLARLARRFQTLGLAQRDGEVAAQDEPHPVQAAAFSVLGLYLAFDALVDIAGGLGILAEARALEGLRGGTWSWLSSYSGRVMLVGVVQLVAACMLFLRSGRLAAFWSRLQARAA